MKLSAMILLLAIISLGTGCTDKDKSEKVSAPNAGINQAIVMGDIETVQQHIEAGTDLNEDEWTHGSSPLITAAVFGELEITKMLINAGAELNFKNDEGSTPLITAAAFEHTDVAKLLIDSGANIDLTNNDGSTALMLAVLYSNIDLVKSLLDKGANREIINKFGRSALTIAQSPFAEIEEILSKLEEGLRITLDREKIKKDRPVIAKMLR
jgi:hypothetical protein